MKRRRHTPEQVIRKLREAERLIGEGKTIPEAAKELGISEQTYHRWRNQYGGMKADDAKRLKELERENATLKRIVADKELENEALKEIAQGNWWARPAGAGRSRCFVTVSASPSAGRAGWWGSTAQPSVTSRRRPRMTRRCAPSCGRSRRSVRGGGIVARIIGCARGLGGEPQAGAATVARGGAAGARSASASAGGSGTRRSRPSGCAPSGPTTCGRSIFSSTRPPTAGR